MSEGKKYDQGKAPISLIPVEALIEQAKVFDFGAKKYGRHNFRLGMDHTRVLDAALRHILAIVNGEDNDPESGLPHYAHALCCLSMYGYFKANNVGKDDRAKAFLEEQSVLDASNIKFAPMELDPSVTCENFEELIKKHSRETPVRKKQNEQR